MMGEKCEHCSGRPGTRFDTQFDMAFQPIVSMSKQTIFAHEALVRGPNGEGAGTILSAVNDQNRYNFDQALRKTAIQRASELGMNEHLSINFMPNAVYEPRNCIQATLWAAEKYDFPIERIIFEFTEGEQIADLDHVKTIVSEYKKMGFLTAIDDFGAGFAGLGLLADLQPDLIKIDMGLIRNIDQDLVRSSIVEGIVGTATKLGIQIIAEGIESEAERDALVDMGIDLLQGYLFARPSFRAITPSDRIFPLDEASAVA